MRSVRRMPYLKDMTDKVTLGSSILIGFAILAASSLQAGETPSPPDDEQRQTILEAIGERTAGSSVAFRDVIQLLQASRFEDANAALSRRIAHLKRLHEQRVVVVESEPMLGDCLTLSYMLNLYLDHPSVAKEAAAYMVTTLKLPDTAVLLGRFEQYQREAKTDPNFSDLLRRMAEMMQMTIDMQRQPRQE